MFCLYAFLGLPCLMYFVLEVQPFSLILSSWYKSTIDLLQTNLIKLWEMAGLLLLPVRNTGAKKARRAPKKQTAKTSPTRPRIYCGCSDSWSIWKEKNTDILYHIHSINVLIHTNPMSGETFWEKFRPVGNLEKYRYLHCWHRKIWFQKIPWQIQFVSRH